MSRELRGPGTRREPTLAALADGAEAPGGMTPVDARNDPPMALPSATAPPGPNGELDDAMTIDPSAGTPTEELTRPAAVATRRSRISPTPVIPRGRGIDVTRTNHPIQQAHRRITAPHQPRLTRDLLRRRPRPRPLQKRQPGVGLSLLVCLALLATFVSWVSAEPFWLAVGHPDTGMVRVTHCTGQGDLGTRCVGRFHTTDGEYAVEVATVSGAATADRTVGTTMPARMVSGQGRIAYVGDAAGLHVRWLVGLGLLLVIGFGIAAATGAWRFRKAARAGAVACSLLAPLLLAGVSLALTH
ncbi:MAG: hypothetical protein ACRDUA_20080 [Micromonosporaceae bacterium]